MGQRIDHKRPLNFFRILWHFCVGIIVFILVYFSKNGFRPDIWFLSLSSAVIFLIEILRFKTEKGKRFFWKYFGFLASDKEANGVNTSLYYTISLLICSLIYLREAVLGAIVCLALGDPVAIIIGTKFGRIRIKKKSVEGALANFVICLIVLTIVLPSVKMAFAGALAGAFIEIMPLPADDNITIPLFSGGAISIAAAFF
ncbi:MAG: hypothetical protein JW814_08460 [Candidatus Krumholzibacteriota bacterium]|nr:hypothetical protein [Candidatus Krumholzibacteriota bacterium]